MRINWLGTTAVALVIGTGAVVAQTQTDQKREETPRAEQSKSKDANRPAAARKAQGEQQKAQTAQPEPKEQRGEAASAQERKQAQEPQQDTKQPTKQSQDQRKRGEPSPAASQQSREQQNGRDTKQAVEPKQKQDNQARETKQPEQKNQARDAKQPADTKQQSQQQPAQQPSSNQAAQPSPSTKQPSTMAQQPSTSTTQQSAQPSTTGQTQPGQTTGQATDQSRTGTASTSAAVNDPQRTQLIARLRNDRMARNQNINVQMKFGERLPQFVRARPLPPDIVSIEPRYRGYEFAVVEDQVYIVEPRTKKVVDVIREPGSSMQSQTTFRSERVMLTTEQRETLKQSVRRLSSAPVAGTPSGSPADLSCLTLQPVPEELARANPELGQYRMLAIGDQIVLVDPRQQKVVEVIE